jgi:hypothetical protein
MLRFSAALVALLAFGGAAAFAQTTAAAPSVAATPNGPAMARALDWYHRLQTGDIDRSQLSPKMDETLAPATVSAVQAKLAALGDPVSFVQKQVIDRAGATMYVYDLTYKGGSHLLFMFTSLASGKIVGLQFAPAQ